ncbi:hypothetical protein GF339_00260 [candidate division KSB3 bacterium]|uniref:DUF4349 domain-containing protein n=1 Tax=candidate division KSB3 bacterium TaxID=2044937 RepID=A0A9D5Q4J0_9BACT|nr:hypothetical protein [candidate division KSB3 bacterium]MBD3322981.1 hypothetical protein [candidate division KSB3 bacterium]
MSKVWRTASLAIVSLLVVCQMPLSSTFAAPEPSKHTGEVLITVQYEGGAEFLARYQPRLTVSLLDDRDDLLTQIERLREASKGELEPLMRQYMYLAESLTQIALQQAPPQQKVQKQAQIADRFHRIEQKLSHVLTQYRTRIASLLRKHTLRTLPAKPLSAAPRRFKAIPPGRYRIYTVLRFATTTLTWFEPVQIQGGDRPNILLTRENMRNPDWTELNWWSFMNLDFSKHH